MFASTPPRRSPGPPRSLAQRQELLHPTRPGCPMVAWPLSGPPLAPTGRWTQLSSSCSSPAHPPCSRSPRHTSGSPVTLLRTSTCPLIARGHRDPSPTGTSIPRRPRRPFPRPRASLNPLPPTRICAEHPLWTAQRRWLALRRAGRDGGGRALACRLLDAQQRAGDRLRQLAAMETARVSRLGSVTRDDHQEPAVRGGRRRTWSVGLPCAARVRGGDAWRWGTGRVRRSELRGLGDRRAHSPASDARAKDGSTACKMSTMHDRDARTLRRRF